ncbi:taste receptor type 2 member 8-like, partial [Spea bombifrons]|uniref:taste receptor type 2 member 8-like n=1 Tax=Spea bombifrons TaxID=233779 RepID=UPI00234B6215
IFVVAVNFVDWWKRRKMNDSDKIICSLAFSRISWKFSFVVTYHWFDSSSNKMYLYVFLHIFFLYIGLWFTTLLSVFYFLKIANDRHVLFLYMRRVISQRLLGFIVVATLIAVCNASLYTWALYNDERAKNSTYSLTEEFCSREKPELHEIFFIVGNCGPFLILSFSSILLITSLCRHMKNMRSFSTNHLNSYHAAIKSMVICFFIYMLYVGFNILILCVSSINSLLLYALQNIFPVLHTGYLICSMTKLRLQFTKMVQCGTNCLRRRTGTGSNASN